MKKTNKCHICGKRYKITEYDPEPIRINYCCWTCDLAFQSAFLMKEAFERQYKLSLRGLMAKTGTYLYWKAKEANE